MQQAMQLDLPFSPEVLQAWRVPLGAATGLELAITLTRSGAECMVTHTFFHRDWSDVLGDLGEVDTQVENFWQMKLNLQPPVSAELSRHRYREDDIPVPGDEPALPWSEQPLFAKLLAMVVHDLAEHGLLEEILAASRTLRIMARHLESCWVERGLQAA